MSGSIKWFIYTTDLGTDFAIKLDESNTESVNSTFNDFPNGGILINALPRNITPRFMRFKSADGKTSRRCIVLHPLLYFSLPNSFVITSPVDGTIMHLSDRGAERIFLPFGPDTGLNDGDVT